MDGNFGGRGEEELGEIPGHGCAKDVEGIHQMNKGAQE